MYQGWKLQNFDYSSNVIEGERNFLMIIMGGYSDDLSDHCVFALYKAENFYLAQDRTLVRQSAGKSARQKFLQMFQPITLYISPD